MRPQPHLRPDVKPQIFFRWWISFQNMKYFDDISIGKPYIKFFLLLFLYKLKQNILMKFWSIYIRKQEEKNVYRKIMMFFEKISAAIDLRLLRLKRLRPQPHMRLRMRPKFPAAPRGLVYITPITTALGFFLLFISAKWKKYFFYFFQKFFCRIFFTSKNI